MPSIYMLEAILSAFTQYLSFGVKISSPCLIFLLSHHLTSFAISNSPHGFSPSPPPFVYMPKAIPSAFARYPSFGIKMQRPHLSFSSKHHGTANTISVSPHGIPVRPSPFVYMPKAMPEDTPSICL